MAAALADPVFDRRRSNAAFCNIPQGQDAYAAKRTEIRLFDPISLTLQPELTVYDVLQMMHQEYICFTYDGPTKLSAADALEEAQACLRALSQQVVPLLINTKAEVTIELQLAVLYDNSDEPAIFCGYAIFKTLLTAITC